MLAPRMQCATASSTINEASQHPSTECGDEPIEQQLCRVIHESKRYIQLPGEQS